MKCKFTEKNLKSIIELPFREIKSSNIIGSIPKNFNLNCLITKAINYLSAPKSPKFTLTKVI